MRISDFQRLSKKALQVLWVAAACPHGMTYRGLMRALGVSDRESVRRAVREAEGAGLVTVRWPPKTGPGQKAVIRLTPQAHEALRAAGLGKAAHA